MSETIFSRVLAVLRESGLQGIRTDVLAKTTKCCPVVLANYIKRHRQAGVEIHTVLGIHEPSTLFCRLEWAEASKANKLAAIDARRKARDRKRSQEKSELTALRRAKAEAQSAAKKAQSAAEPARPHVGPLPDAHELPSQPVYSRHQLADLPPGFVSSLNPNECRPWAMAASK